MTRYQIAGKIVIVTGAANGIGAAMASQLHHQGATVALLDVDTDAVNRHAATLGDRAIAITADVRDRTALSAAVTAVTERFGRLDIVVAGAGVAPVPATVRLVDPTEFDRVVAINQTGVFNTVHASLEHVVRHRGHVVVVASVAAFVPGPGGAAYMVSKAAVEQLGRALRLELAASGATAGIAYFGIVNTAMTHNTLDDDPLGRQLLRLLPWPLNQRITPEQAAAVIIGGITRRAPRTVAPFGWWPYLLFRGLLDPVVDAYSTRSPRLRALQQELEQRLMLDQRNSNTPTS